MPVITRQKARALAAETDSPRQHHSQEGVSPALLTWSIANRTQEATQTRAEALARCLQPSRFESLPAEIIELIAQKLRDQEREENRFDDYDIYEVASDATDRPAPCECQYQYQGVPDHRKNKDVKVVGPYRSCEPSIPLSSTSRRFRTIVFDHRPHRMKVVKYCIQAMEDSVAMRPAIRDRVK